MEQIRIHARRTFTSVTVAGSGLLLYPIEDLPERSFSLKVFSVESFGIALRTSRLSLHSTHLFVFEYSDNLSNTHYGVGVSTDINSRSSPTEQGLRPLSRNLS